MKNVLKIFIVGWVLVTICFDLASAQQADFSGSWVRDNLKSKSGEKNSINTMPVVLIIEQSQSLLLVTRKYVNRIGDSTIYTEKLNFNSDPAMIVVKAGLNKKAGIKWQDDRHLQLKASYSNNRGPINQILKEDWSLSEDGEILRIVADLTADGDNYHMEEIFNKRK